MNCDPLDSTTFMGASVQNVGYGQTESGDNSLKWWTVEEVIDLTPFDFTVDGHGVSSVCYGDSGGPSMLTMPDGYTVDPLWTTMAEGGPFHTRGRIGQYLEAYRKMGMSEIADRMERKYAGQRGYWD